MITGLKDSNPRVRKAAVIGCAKVWRHSPDIINNNGIVDVLYTMVTFMCPIVVELSFNLCLTFSYFESQIHTNLENLGLDISSFLASNG